MTAKCDPHATRRLPHLSLLCDVAYHCGSELHPTLWFDQINPVLTSAPPSTVSSIPFNRASTALEPFDRHRQWTPSPHCHLLASPLISLTPSCRSLYVLRLPAFPSVWVLMFLRLQLLATPCPRKNCLQLYFLGLFWLFQDKWVFCIVKFSIVVGTHYKCIVIANWGIVTPTWSATRRALDAPCLTRLEVMW